MTLNAREKKIAWLVGAALVLYVGYTYVYAGLYSGPLSDVEKQIAKARQEQQTNQALLDNRKKVKDEWTKLEQAGLSTDMNTAAAVVTSRITQIGQGNRISLFYSSPGVTRNQRLDFDELPLNYTFSTNSMRLSTFVYDLERSGLPIRVDGMNIGTKTQGNDDLNVEMKVVILLYAPKGTNTIAGTRPATRPALARSGASTMPSLRPMVPSTAPAAAAPASATPGKPRTPEEIAAELRARRLREDGVAVETPAASTTTQPAGGVR